MPEVAIPVRQRGLLVKILVRPANQRHSIQAVGPFTAYLDTGASHSMFDPAILGHLQVQPTRSAALNVLGREDVSFHDTFDVEIALHAGEPIRWFSLSILEGPVYRTGAVARFSFAGDARLRWARATSHPAGERKSRANMRRMLALLVADLHQSRNTT